MNDRAVAMHIIEADHDDLCPMKHDQWPKHPLERCPDCDLVNRAYKQAVLDAVNAIKALPAKDRHEDDDGLISLCFDKGEAVAAIEALGGER